MRVVRGRVRGSHLPSVLRHLVDHPAGIAVDNHTLLAPLTIVVDGRDGERTVIAIQAEGEFVEHAVSHGVPAGRPGIA